MLQRYNPTPAGEGKTTTTVGLGQAMAKLGKKALIALEENHLLDRVLESREAQQAEDMLRLCRWKI